MPDYAALILDIGNTNITFGLFVKGTCTNFWRLSSDPRRTDDEYAIQVRRLLSDASIDPRVVSHVVIGSVVPVLSYVLDSAVKKALQVTPFHITHDLKLPVKNSYSNPREVGIDRLANAAGGVHAYGAPLIVVDLGTAVTLDIISSKKEYLGGSILPGVEMAADALSKRTARLPLASAAPPQNVIGRTTVESIRSGLMLGLVGSVDYLIDLIWKELGYKTATVATGGYASFIIQKSQYVKTSDDELTLRGLLQIFELNSTPAPRPSKKK